ncbi:putative membrane transport protein [Helianthus annuus]|uniref:Membrane transport protein n=1 Tax=Helianthus annuus TaxID=4232 RepID=A0A251U056_HELAN|nr:protein PIN-LIKES 2 [Helianthus annuus]KAF5791462.1 putative membrane transport protein [Helianthus annuus]KAJ0526525.1 putative membrane transport protein [Helianthus annuus]KAJ0534976.1 putative membrane transport protein [Helianthus annuus]KAJ0542918.1 putative membrane transport protein [Helianthus annuus]KAJ0707973.1 putative membrane transport protein [Helianthus annuus]
MGFSDSEVKFGQQELIHAVVPLLKLLCLAVIGTLLAHPKTQIVPKSTFKLLSKLVFALFLPCTIFFHLGQSISVQNLALWWFIPVNVIISTVIGCLLGLLVAVICRPPPEFFRFTVIVTGFGNTGNLMLAIVGSICHNANNSFSPNCHTTGTAYVSLAQWVSVLLVYTLVYHMMEPPLEYYEVVEDEGEIEIVHEDLLVNNLSRPLLHEAEWPGMEDQATEHCKTPFIARVFANVSDFSQSSIPDPDSLQDVHEREHPQSPKSIRCLAEPRMVRKMRIVAEQTPVRHILQPPTVATFLALIIGMVPSLKSIVYGDDAPLSFLTDSLDIMAGAMVPSVMLVLGGMLAEGPNESRLGIRTTVGILVARLLILPMLGIGVVFAADRLSLLIEGDKMFRFVLLLQYTTPSAILFGAIASLRGYAVSEASALLFWQHVFALFSLSMYSIIYIKLLLTYI